MNRFGAILVFYKSLIMWSFLINILFIMVTPDILITILTKLFFLILILHFLNETKIKSKLLICNNLDLSQIKLFSIIFILDSFMTVFSLMLLKVFI